MVVDEEKVSLGAAAEEEPTPTRDPANGELGKSVSAARPQSSAEEKTTWRE
jgi:hypothetical protein